MAERRSGPARSRPPIAKHGRNREWKHLFNRDIISMPDKWEYPWFAAWDLAFHMMPIAQVDPILPRSSSMLFLREWYMHPNGQIAGLRIRLRRCESAGARLGRLAGVQNDRRHAASAIAPFSKASFKSC